MAESAFKSARRAAKGRAGQTKHEAFAQRLASLQGQNPHRRVAEDEVGGSYKAGSPQRIARPSVQAMGTKPATPAGRKLRALAMARK